MRFVFILILALMLSSFGLFAQEAPIDPRISTGLVNYTFDDPSKVVSYSHTSEWITGYEDLAVRLSFVPADEPANDFAGGYWRLATHCEDSETPYFLPIADFPSSPHMLSLNLDSTYGQEGYYQVIDFPHNVPWVEFSAIQLKRIGNRNASNEIGEEYVDLPDNMVEIQAFDVNGNLVASTLNIPYTKPYFRSSLWMADYTGETVYCPDNYNAHWGSHSLAGAARIRFSSNRPDGIRRLMFKVHRTNEPDPPDEPYFYKNWSRFSALIFIDDITIPKGFANDLWLGNVTIAQTVYNPDFIPGISIDPLATTTPKDEIYDLVKGKQAKILVDLNSSFPNDLEHIYIKVEVKKFSGEPVPLKTSSYELNAESTSSISIDLPTDQQGQFSVSLLIDSENTIRESNENNNLSQTFKYIVHEVPALNIGFVPVRGCEGSYPCYLGVTNEELDALASKSLRLHMNDVFPVADGNLTFHNLTEENFEGRNRSYIDEVLSDIFDPITRTSLTIAADIAKLAQLRNQVGVRKLIGVVGPQYFEYHEKFGTKGLVIPSQSLNVGLASWSNQNIVIHETGHLLGQHLEMYRKLEGEPFEADISDEVLGWDKKGFNARSNTKLETMTPIMGGRANLLLNDFWITPNTYYKAFNTLLKPDIDPERIEVTGLLGKDGSFELLSIEEHESGLLTGSEIDGTFSVRTLNSSSTIIDEIAVKPAFELHLIGSENGDGFDTIDLPYTPIVISVAKTDETEKIQIFNNGEVVDEVEIEKPLMTTVEIVRKIDFQLIEGRNWFIKALRQFSLIFTAAKIDYKIKTNKVRSAEAHIKRLKKLIDRSVSNESAKPGRFSRSEAIEELNRIFESLKIRKEKNYKKPSKQSHRGHASVKKTTKNRLKNKGKYR